MSVEADLSAIRSRTVDYVFNFASPASPVGLHKLGVETLMVGSEGTRNALDIAKKYGAKFLHASTSECYGDPSVHPQTEDYWGNVNPIGLRSVYDEAKRFSEALVMAYHRYYGVDTHLVRIFNTYGPRLQKNDGRVISNFMMQALKGEDLTVYGEGEQTRSFCYVSDEIEGILGLSRSDEHLPVNIGNPTRVDDPGLCEGGSARDRIEEQDRVLSVAADDPMQRPAGHQQGKKPFRLGAQDRS